MKREGTIGAATFLAIAAAVGFSLQPGPKQAESSRADRNVESKRPKATITKGVTHKEMPGCRSLQEELKDFLAVEQLALPKVCYELGDTSTDTSPEGLSEKTSQLKFVIAMVPDPVHSHLSALFDQFAVAIQEGAQDEKYDFDGSWFPWDEEASSYALLADEKEANREKQLREEQPGIMLFRKTLECSDDELKQPGGCKEELAKSYRKGLIVFFVGEETTHGIHKEQFYNALEWIADLEPKTDVKRKRLAILGPTFSGSLPSLAAVLTDPRITDPEIHDPKKADPKKSVPKKADQKLRELLDLWQERTDQRLAIYSGRVSSNLSAQVSSTRSTPTSYFTALCMMTTRFCGDSAIT
jgi:hypothetical protein